MKFELFKDKSKWLRRPELLSNPVVIKETEHMIPEEDESELPVVKAIDRFTEQLMDRTAPFPDEITDIPEPAKTAMKESEKNPGREFQRTFQKLTRSHRAWDVWRDFIVMYACAVSNAVDKSHYDIREQRYLKIIKNYSKPEQELFPELAAWMVLAMDENPEQDFLGEIFMDLGLGESKAGQFFTPYHVCELMAKIVESNDICGIVEKEGYFTINDPCCGAGATLIAGIHEARRQLETRHWNFQDHILVAAQDVDEVVALMCYIQVSLLGVAGFVKVGNSFTEPMKPDDDLENYWFTPMYFSQTWVMRRFINNFESEIN